MSGLSDIVSISITRETKVPSQAGFGFVNFVSAVASFTGETIRSYSSLSEVSADSEAGADSVAFATDYFAQNPRPTRLYITKKGAGTYLAALQAAQLVTDDWYGVAIASRVLADVQAVAGWVETQIKLFATASADPDILLGAEVDDVAYVLKNAGYDRSIVFYHSDAATDWPEAALLGLQFAKTPGSSTYVYKTLAGISADSLTTTQKTAALNKNAFVYTVRGGINCTEGGKVASGEWVDIIVGIDDLTADIESRVYGKLINSDKIEYTNAGITVVVGAVREALRRSVTNKVLAEDPQFTVTAPLVSDVSAANKGNRVLPDVEFEATLAGAIHKTTIAGRVVL